ncbi:hypothetical protein F5888DRAFT_1638680 [Russula emetica]|nr:hypothetical protein F5888DRAFT_1638680 [Russula emetica]
MPQAAVGVTVLWPGGPGGVGDPGPELVQLALARARVPDSVPAEGLDFYWKWGIKHLEEEMLVAELMTDSLEDIDDSEAHYSREDEWERDMILIVSCQHWARPTAAAFPMISAQRSAATPKRTAVFQVHAIVVGRYWWICMLSLKLVAFSESHQHSDAKHVGTYGRPLRAYNQRKNPFGYKLFPSGKAFAVKKTINPLNPILGKLESVAPASTQLSIATTVVAGRSPRTQPRGAYRERALRLQARPDGYTTSVAGHFRISGPV